MRRRLQTGPMYLKDTTQDRTPPTLLMAIPNGTAGVRATLEIMRELARQGKTNPVIRIRAAELVKNLPSKNWVAEIKALHEFVRDRIRYTKDINGVETVHTPQRVLEQGYGDCDDKATLLGAMLESIGHPARFVAVGFQPGKFSHVYVETRIGRNPGRWVALETTEPVVMGWSPKNVRARMMKHI